MENQFDMLNTPVLPEKNSLKKDVLLKAMGVLQNKRNAFFIGFNVLAILVTGIIVTVSHWYLFAGYGVICLFFYLFNKIKPVKK